MSSSQAPKRQRRTGVVHADQTHTLYRFFDAEGTLLYIGITGNPRARWSQHSKTKEGWRRVDTIRVQHLDSREELEAAEKAAIKAERPLWNVAHNEPTRTVAEVRIMLDQRQWLSVADVAVLFGVERPVAKSWVTRGSKVLPGLKPEQRGRKGRVEVEPDWVAALLLECRKVRSCRHPDGIPGKFVDPPHWRSAH